MRTPTRSWPPATEPRTAELKLRLAPDEMALLMEKAALAKRSPSDFLRVVVLGSLYPSLIEQERQGPANARVSHPSSTEPRGTLVDLTALLLRAVRVGDSDGTQQAELDDDAS